MTSASKIKSVKQSFHSQSIIAWQNSKSIKEVWDQVASSGVIADCKHKNEPSAHAHLWWLLKT